MRYEKVGVKEQKQLVAFLDLLGFGERYDLINRQTIEDTKKYLFHTSHQLYNVYLDRIKAALKIGFVIVQEARPELLKDLDENFLDSLSNPHFFPISDCFIIAIDCDDSNVSLAYLVLSNCLAFAIEEIMIFRNFREDVEKMKLPVFNPIRGGISYGFSEINLKYGTLHIYSLPYYEAVCIEKEASWPRIGISKHLTKILSPFYRESIAECSGKLMGSFFDIAYFKYNISQSISNQKEKITFLENFSNIFKNYIIFNAEHCALTLQSETNKERRKKLSDKYQSWTEYYNDRVSQLITIDPLFIGRTDLLIEKGVLTKLIQDITG